MPNLGFETLFCLPKTKKFPSLKLKSGLVNILLKPWEEGIVYLSLKDMALMLS